MVPLLLMLVSSVMADYECVCNYNVEKIVYAQPNVSGKSVGVLYETDCKPTVADTEYPNEVKEIQFEHQPGFIKIDPPRVQLQICSGNPSTNDTITTNNANASHEHSTPLPTTTTITTTLATAAATSPTSTHGTIPEGHVELCPAHIKTDANIYRGFVGQFGDYCYELVDTPTYWDDAHGHCTRTSSGGYLLQIMNEQEQNFVVRFLTEHFYVKEVWTGLNDKYQEGNWKWNSGVPVGYTHFQGDFSSHSNLEHLKDDCVLLKQGGEWTDAPCGSRGLLGLFGYGESYPYICQYSVSSKPPSIFESILGIIG